EKDLKKTRLGKYFKLLQSFVCTEAEDRTDTCTGDGGSPLICSIQGHENRYFQTGIVAWGVGCSELRQLGTL
ncbi:Trypsin domain containing protein, partial [Asbolus verrucosus]